jgi:hypothetical protein
MRFIVRSLIVVSIVCACRPARVAAQGEAPSDGYWFCYSQPDQDPIYVTPVWDARVSKDLITIEFRKVLAVRYNYKGYVTCGAASKTDSQNTLAKVDAGRQQVAERWQKSGKKIVQTGWTSSQPPVGPPTAAWSSCAAMIVAKDAKSPSGPMETYVSAPFDAGQATVQEQQAAFKSFLISKYAITTTDLNPLCQFAADETGALQAINVRMNQGRGRGKVIETGWKFAK